MGGRSASSKPDYKTHGFDKSSLEKHFDRHVLKRKDTIAKDKLEYQKMAIKFRDKKITINSHIEEFISHSGLKFKYNKDTKEFIIFEKSGKIQTYYTPTNPDKYWQTQIKLHKSAERIK